MIDIKNVLKLKLLSLTIMHSCRGCCHFHSTNKQNNSCSIPKLLYKTQCFAS
ncbi:hypothetical protein HanPSC8_Chr10g0441461 [Helianthus annuus]|nr:hypothetical protein HanPSC8_Chr10g0441461 [Helianthus annuus]